MDKFAKTELIYSANELISLAPNEVVKTASILRKIKNLWKKFFDPEYKSQVEELAKNTVGLSELAGKLSHSLKELSTSLIDSDIENYDKYLATTKNQLSELIQVLRTNDRTLTDVAKEQKQKVPVKPKEKEVKPGEMPEGFDIPVSKEIDELEGQRPLSYTWLKEIKKKTIYKSEQASKIFFSAIKRAIKIKTAKEVIDKNKDEIWKRFELAVFEGTVLRAGHFKTFEGKKTIQAIPLTVATAPFDLPDLNFRIKAYVILNDVRTSLSREASLSLRETIKIEVLNVPLVELAQESIDHDPISKNFDGIDIDYDDRDYCLAKEYLIQKIIKKAVNTSAYKLFPNEFWLEFVKMCQRIGANSLDLAQVLWTESGFDPAAINYQGGKPVAKGLNQLVLVSPSRRKFFGMSDEMWNNYEHLSALEQLPWVEKYFKLIGNATKVDKWDSPEQLYVANFAPKYVHQANDPNAVLYQKHNEDGSVAKEYTQNAGLDRENKGFINVNDLHRFVLVKMPEELKNKITNAQMQFGGKSEMPENDNDIDELMMRLVAHKYPLTYLVKQAMIPKTELSFVIYGGSKVENIEFARVLGNLSTRFLKLASSVKVKEFAAELTVNGQGNPETVKNAVNSLYKPLSQKFNKKAHTEINCVINEKKSLGRELDEEELIANNRKFCLEQLVK